MRPPGVVLKSAPSPLWCGELLRHQEGNEEMFLRLQVILKSYHFRYMTRGRFDMKTTLLGLISHYDIFHLYFCEIKVGTLQQNTVVRMLLVV